uniref:Uncharacterized protein n=1 Tax=Romanomermis culicivorax TaxID=13658 RepID=A0A915K3B7_ROMCU
MAPSPDITLRDASPTTTPAVVA